MHNRAPLYKHPLTLALLGVAATLLFFFAVNPAFFFVDDRVAQYFPYGLVIKDMLLHGVFPFTTTRTFYGGALWLDWQYGIYNPLSLLLTPAIMPQHLGVSGLIYALVLDLLMTAGAYRVGRSYGLDAPFAALFGLLMGININVIYIYANDWAPALASIAWLMFAWASLKNLMRAEGNIARGVLVTALFVYLMFTSGWPHSDAAFCLIAAAVFVEDILRRRRGGRRFALTVALSGALCAPALVPVLASLPWTDHHEVKGLETIAPLEYLLSVSNPGWPPRIRSLADNLSAPFPPLFFIGWFTLPALFFIRWKAIRWKDYAGLFALLALFGALTCGLPENQYLNFPLRWLPEVHALFLLILFLVLQEKRLADFDVPRLKYALGAAALLAVLTFAAYPDVRRLALLAGPVALVPLLLYPESRRGLACCLGVTSILMAMVVAKTYPFNLLFVPWQKATATLEAGVPENRGYTFFSGMPRLHAQLPPPPADLPREAEFPTSGLPLYYGVNSINGYSSIRQREAQRVLGCLPSGPICTIIPLHPLMRREAGTGQRYLDLLKVDRVVTDDKDWENKTAKMLPDWKRSLLHTTASFDRPKPSSLPGTMSWHAAGLSVSDGGALSNGEYAEVKNGPAPSLVAYARLYYPGFRATLAGQTLDVRPIDGLLVGVKVPANVAGRLELSFLPPFFGISCAVALIGLILWGCGAIVERRRNHNR